MFRTTFASIIRSTINCNSRIYSIPAHDKHQWLLLQFMVLLMMDAKVVRNMHSVPVVFNKHNTARVASCTVRTDLEHLYRIYSIPAHDKHQWLLLQFMVLLMMDAKGVRNMQSIPAVVNKQNIARVASCWFIIYYKSKHSHYRQLTTDRNSK